MTPRDYWYCFVGVQKREWLRFWQQRTRFASALVRPLLWLVVFAQGLLGTVVFLAFFLIRFARHVRSRRPVTMVGMGVPSRVVS